MSGFNKAIILGNLGKDPEMRAAGNSNVCNFPVATSETWIDKDKNKQEKTEWHRIVVWGKQADACNKFLKKGSKVLIEGRLATRKWEKDGKEMYTTEVIAEHVQFLSTPRQMNDDGIGDF